MTLKYDGQLEIDQKRGVIYFHGKQGVTLLRICSLPKPIPTPLTVKAAGKDYVKWPPEINPLDITFGFGVSWAPCTCNEDSDSIENTTCPIHGIVKKES